MINRRNRLPPEACSKYNIAYSDCCIWNSSVKLFTTRSVKPVVANKRIIALLGEVQNSNEVLISWLCAILHERGYSTIKWGKCCNMPTG